MAAFQPLYSLKNSATSSSEGNDSMLCVICIERKKTHLLYPCGHYSYCGTCVEFISECAMCRKHIVHRIKVYN